MPRPGAATAAWIGVIGWCLGASGVVPAFGPACEIVEAAPAVSRLRAGDATAARLLEAAAERSATFRSLAATVEASDLVVYVQTLPMSLPGQLQLLAATPGCRHLRITIRVPGLENERIAWLAHELRHAVEIAGAPEVRDQRSLIELYRRIGVGRAIDATAESAEAQEVWRTVRRELREGTPR